MANTKQPKQPSEEELNSFLSKVDELDSVLKGLNSKNEDEQVEYTKKADQLIEKFDKEKGKKGSGKENNDNDDDDADLPETKFGFSRTCINKDAYKNESPADVGPPLPPGQGDMDQKAFMAAMEADAKERYERKKKAEKVAAGLKEQGNIAFKKGDYQEALDFYDKAINEVRDSSVLYTNRAQAKIKLGMYQEALSDCDWALRAWPNSVKAYVHQGHAYLALKQWKEARESYNAILTLDPKKEGIVKDYLSEVSRQEQASEDEKRASSLFEEGNEMSQGLVDLLTRVKKSDQLPPFYAGGFRVITGLLKDKDSQTLFRTNDGLKLAETHTQLHRYLTSSPASLSREEKDALSAALEMFTAASNDNETSQQQLFSQPDFPSRLLNLLEVKVKGQGRQLKSSCLNLLYKTSLTEAGRSCIVGHMELTRLISALFPLMTKKSQSYGDLAAAVLNNISLEKRSKTLLRSNIEETIIPAFEDLLRNNRTTADILGLACSTATNLAADITIRNKLATRQDIWNILSPLMTTYLESGKKEALVNILGLLVNISTKVESEHLRSLSLDVCRSLDQLLEKLLPPSSSTTTPAPPTSSSTTTTTTSGTEGQTQSQDGTAVAKLDQDQEISVRTLVVLSNILPLNQASAVMMSEMPRLKRVLGYCNCAEPLMFKPALKCLTAVTQWSYDARLFIVENKGLAMLLTHLSSQDEAVAGNSALSLSHLVKDSGRPPQRGGEGKQTLGSYVCAKLVKTNIVQKLLVLARDGRKSNLQGNSAILLANLAQGDARHLERLRELHGIQILHECMKHVNY